MGEFEAFPEGVDDWLIFSSELLENVPQLLFMVLLAQVVPVEIGDVQRKADENQHPPEEGKPNQLGQQHDSPESSGNDHAPPKDVRIDWTLVDFDVIALEIPALLFGVVLPVPPPHSDEYPAGDVLGHPKVNCEQRNDRNEGVDL